MTLRWDPPAVLGDTSVNYIIGYIGASTLFTTSNIFEVTGLSPSTTFNFSVKANNSVGTSAPVYVIAMTTDGTYVQYECIYLLYSNIIGYIGGSTLFTTPIGVVNSVLPQTRSM